jgi:hypothetical protein
LTDHDALRGLQRAETQPGGPTTPQQETPMDPLTDYMHLIDDTDLDEQQLAMAIDIALLRGAPTEAAVAERLRRIQEGTL